MPVRKLKKLEYGKTLAFGAGVDLSTATSLTVEFTKPDGVAVEEAATLGVANLTGDDANCEELTFLANEYATVVVPEGLLDQAGRWCARLLAPTATSSIPSESVAFYVVDC